MNEIQYGKAEDPFGWRVLVEKNINFLILLFTQKSHSSFEWLFLFQFLAFIKDLKY